jgi:hypothetical protein
MPEPAPGPRHWAIIGSLPCAEFPARDTAAVPMPCFRFPTGHLVPGRPAQHCRTLKSTRSPTLQWLLCGALALAGLWHSPPGLAQAGGEMTLDQVEAAAAARRAAAAAAACCCQPPAASSAAGAVGAANGPQSGSESRMSSAIVPLNSAATTADATCLRAGLV